MFWVEIYVIGIRFVEYRVFWILFVGNMVKFKFLVVIYCVMVIFLKMFFWYIFIFLIVYEGIIFF